MLQSAQTIHPGKPGLRSLPAPGALGQAIVASGASLRGSDKPSGWLCSSSRRCQWTTVQTQMTAAVKSSRQLVIGPARRSGLVKEAFRLGPGGDPSGESLEIEWRVLDFEGVRGGTVAAAEVICSLIQRALDLFPDPIVLAGPFDPHYRRSGPRRPRKPSTALARAARSWSRSGASRALGRTPTEARWGTFEQAALGNV